MTVATILFALLGLCSLVLVAVGLPGTWILLAVAVVLELIDHLWVDAVPPITFGWLPIIIALAMNVIGELIEFATGAVGTKLGGGNRRGMIGAIVGGFVGAVVGTGIIPIIGTLIFALLGTFVGALVGEMTGPEAKNTQEALPAAIAGAIGRIMGIFAKVGIGMAIWLGLTGAMIYNYFYAA